MNKGVWFAAGAAAGVYVTSRARRLAEAVTVDGIHDRLSGLFAGARVFGEEVREGMAEKETQLRHQLGLPLPGHLPPGDDPDLDGAEAGRALQRGGDS